MRLNYRFSFGKRQPYKVSTAANTEALNEGKYMSGIMELE